MALAIRSIPTLTDDAAKIFIRKADKNYRKKKSSVDFSKQAEMARQILEKSKI